MRPEHVFVDSNGPLRLQVSFAEPLGANTLLHGRLLGSDSAFTASLQGVHQVPASSELVNLSIASDNIHVFDKQGGRRVD